MDRKVAIILAGCGYLDGSEINEVVLTLTALEIYNIDYDVFVINGYFASVNHINSIEENTKRNALVESARILRGKIIDIKFLDSKKYKAVIIPGGYGIMKHFTNYLQINSLQSDKVNFYHEIDTIIRDFYIQKRVICAMCISPLLISLILSKMTQNTFKVTIGEDKDEMIKKAGGINIPLGPESYYYDSDNNILSSPAYMASENRSVIFTGIKKMINKLCELI